MDYSFDHVHIICEDLPAMAAYFEDVLGAKEVFHDENFHGAPNAVMRLGEAKFFLRGLRPGERPGPNAAEAVMGLDHFSLAVDYAKETSALLKSRGAEFIREPAASGMGGRTTAFIRGPRASGSSSAKGPGRRMRRKKTRPPPGSARSADPGFRRKWARFRRRRRILTRKRPPPKCDLGHT